MSWKQPIPTDLENDFGEDYKVWLLYILVLLKACNNDTVVKWGGKLITVKRGQTIFGRNKWSKYLDMSPKGIEKVLERLEKVPGKITCHRTAICTVITIQNYESIVSMSANQSAKSVPSEYQVSATSKSVKSEESEKNIYNPTSGEAGQPPKNYKDFVDFMNDLTGRKFKYGDTKAQRQLKAALKSGYTRQDFHEAISAMLEDTWHKQNAYKWITPEFITRPSILEKFLAIAKDRVKSQPTKKIKTLEEMRQDFLQAQQT